MEFMTVTGLFEGRRYIAIYRKWFNDKLSAWELELVPGTMRWDLKESRPSAQSLESEKYLGSDAKTSDMLCSA